MAKKRGPDGTPVDVPTHKPTEPPEKIKPETGGDLPTEEAEPPGPGSLFPEEPPTAPAGTPARHGRGDRPSPAGRGPEAEEPKTVIHGGRRRKEEAKAPDSAIAAQTEEGLNDPVAGWLVIIEGPGIGQALTVGHGQNRIGRSPDERISLDFGDGEISRTNHAVITYDPRGRRFFFQQGSGTNLAYVNDEPVLAPVELHSHAEILLGSTRMRFVAFCGPEFSWQDQ